MGKAARQQEAFAVENSLAGPQKVEHGITVGPRKSALKHVPKRTKNMFTQMLVQECSQQHHS